jgi:GNAT superfamily N-acetyltransferase
VKRAGRCHSVILYWARRLRHRVVAKREERPQLRMRKNLRAGCAELLPALPPGYSLRSFTVGDEQKWLHVINSHGEFGSPWNVDDLQDQILANLIEGTGVLAWHEHEVVGCASACRLDGSFSDALLNFVVVLPEHRGQRLGAALTIAAIAGATRAGYSGIILHTDDYRLPAINLYLGLGFEPVIDVDPGASDRWANIYERINTQKQAADLSRRSWTQ